MKRLNTFTLGAAFALVITAASHSASADDATNAAAANAAAAADAKPTQAVIQRIAAQVKPSLVRIHVVEGEPEDGRESKSESFGSGIIISRDGYVVTNHHVAGQAKWLSCTLSNREQVEARLVGTDALSDIAVIKLAPPEGDNKDYPAATWGDSSKLEAGDPVLAMGSPLAFSQSVTAGIVSNTELIIPGARGAMTLNGEDVGSIVRWIGHDAAIHPGNSGGPLVDLNGNIVGINEIQVGLSGAIPGNLAREVCEAIIARGRVLRAETGIDFQPRLRGDRRTAGVLVSGVLPSSPAAKAGIRAGDLLLSAEGKPLDARFPEQIPLVNLEMSRLPVDRPVELKLLRGTQEMTVSVAPRPRDDAQAPEDEIKGWGLTGTDITPLIARENQFPDTRGVLITGIAAGGAAAEAKPPLEEGDVILSSGGKAVTAVAGLKSATKGVKRREGGVPTLVEVRRRNERMMSVVSLNPENSEDASVEVARPYLPVSTQVLVRELAQALGLPEGAKGVRITQVHPGSVAEKAGVKVGDIVAALDGVEVEAAQPEDSDVFPALIRQYKIGATAKLMIVRATPAAPGKKAGWEKKIIAVKLPRAPKQERELANYRDDNFGLVMRSVTYTDRLRKNANPGEAGAIVVSVDQGSWAALAGLEPGDIIRAIDGVAVADMESARARLKELEKQRPRFVVFFVSSGVHTSYVEAQTDWSLTTPPAG